MNLRCPECGSPTTVEVGTHDVGKVIGLPGAAAELTALVCPNGHCAIFEGRELEAVMARLAATLAARNSPLCEAEARFLRKHRLSYGRVDR